jgi:hypothetical protein
MATASVSDRLPGSGELGKVDVGSGINFDGAKVVKPLFGVHKRWPEAKGQHQFRHRPSERENRQRIHR